MEYIQSKNIKENSDFPYLVLSRKNKTSFPRTPGFQTYHWHQDLQFVYVIEGNVCVKTLDKQATLVAGEGMFINRNVVHRIDQKDSGEYKCFVFPEHLLYFYPGSPVVRMTQAITQNPSISFIKFSPENSWCREILIQLNHLVDLETDKSDFYCCEVLSCLSTLWCILLKHTTIPERIPESPVSIRMKKMLEFMEKHYAEEISLDSLAESADISCSETIRCFKNTMQTTPYHYLVNFRLEKAKVLLEETTLPIGQIALQTGFSQQSYFGKCFREKMNCSPREYRKNRTAS